MTNFSIKLEELGQEYAVYGFDDHMSILAVLEGKWRPRLILAKGGMISKRLNSFQPLTLSEIASTCIKFM